MRAPSTASAAAKKRAAAEKIAAEAAKKKETDQHRANMEEARRQGHARARQRAIEAMSLCD